MPGPHNSLAVAMANEYRSAFHALGYNITAGDENHTRAYHETGLSGSSGGNAPVITAHITATTGPNPPTRDLYTRLMHRTLPAYYRGVPVCAMWG